MLKKIVLFGLVAILTMGLSSCINNEYRPSNTADLPEIKYMKDSKGLCYAYTSSVTSYHYVTFSISNVPCEKVGF